MIRLVLARHGKAVDAAPYAPGVGPGHDHARALVERGRRDAARLGVRLLEAGWHPTDVVCSDAARTRETWEHVGAVLARGGVRPEALYDRRLYLAGPDALAEVARDLGDARGCLLAVGHNPGWEEAVARLCGVVRELPTAAAALLELVDPAETWHHAIGRAGAWRLRDLWRPDA